MISSDPAQLRLPADRCFWSLIEAPGIRVTGPLPEALRDDAATDLPLPVEELFLVAAPADGDRLLVCGARRADLADIPDSALTLFPDSVPSALGVCADHESFNFLVGAYEPAPLRRARRHRHAIMAAAAVLSAVLVTIGLARRAHRENAMADAAGLAADTLSHGLVPGQSPAMAVLTLDQELTSLRRSARVSGVVAPPPDAAVQLAALLNVWPSSVSSKPQSLSVSPGAITAAVSIQTKDTGEFLKAVRAPTGWALDEPRMNTASGLTRVSLTMKPSSARVAANKSERDP